MLISKSLILILVAMDLKFNKIIYVEEFWRPRASTNNVLRIKNSCGDRNNIASLCVGKHGGAFSHLDLSLPMIQGISFQGGNFLKLGANSPSGAVRAGSGGFNLNKPADINHRGSSACWGGTIYVAWREYRNVNDALSYLKRYFDVRACESNVRYTQNFFDKIVAATAVS
jgi:hypothetical protein